MNWISVKDRLPENFANVITYAIDSNCYTKCGRGVHESSYRAEDDAFYYGEYDCLLTVTHWMPLPQEPNVEP